MRISTKGEYGVRALFELAQHYGEGPVQSSHIAARQHVPETYLNQLLLTLRNAGLIKSIRGPGGGHMLARPPAEINLGEALAALEGPMVLMDCVNPDFTECSLLEMCVIRDVWRELNEATNDVLYSTTLEELLQSRRERQEHLMYYI